MDTEALSPQQSYTAWLYRPYVDLGPRNSGPSHVYRVEFACHNLAEGTTKRQRPQRVLPHSFRESLLREANLPAYRVSDPLELPDELMSERWKALCDRLRSYAGLDPEAQGHVLGVLSSLCLYPAVEKYSRPLAAEEIAKGEGWAAVAYWRANARFMLHRDYDTPYSIEEFRVIAENAPPGSVIRINALIHMIVQSARIAQDAHAVARWANITRKELDETKTAFDEFTLGILTSRYHRAASYAMQMRNERDALVAEMDLAEKHARSLPRDTEEHRILALENLHPLLQSRTKEAIWLGDLDLAEMRARGVVENDPLDPRARIELGEVLVSQDKVEEAASVYRSAAVLGPPGTAMAWHMAGQCYEALEDYAHACDCFLSALKLDPLGISAAERLKEVALLVGSPELSRWAASVLDGLLAREAQSRS